MRSWKWDLQIWMGDLQHPCVNCPKFGPRFSALPTSAFHLTDRYYPRALQGMLPRWLYPPAARFGSDRAAIELHAGSLPGGATPPPGEATPYAALRRGQLRSRLPLPVRITTVSRAAIESAGTSIHTEIRRLVRFGSAKHAPWAEPEPHAAPGRAGDGTLWGPFHTGGRIAGSDARPEPHRHLCSGPANRHQHKPSCRRTRLGNWTGLRAGNINRPAGRRSGRSRRCYPGVGGMSEPSGEGRCAGPAHPPRRHLTYASPLQARPDGHHRPAETDSGAWRRGGGPTAIAARNSPAAAARSTCHAL